MIRSSLLLLIAVACLSCGGGSGDDDGGALTFTVISVSPNTSSTVNGGDVVTIKGTNFVTVQVFRITFGGQVGFILNTTQTEVTVRTPPAPGRLPGTVAIEVFAGRALAVVINNAYTYADPSVNPVPQTILPTTYTATGAETFQITGQNLGQPGGTIDVTFDGVGTVLATVSASRDIATGTAPISAAAPPAGLVTVSINNGLGNATVPTRIRYDFASPQSLVVGYQTSGNASRPVRLSDGFAVMCTSGTDSMWGNADDEVLVIQGPPAAIFTILPARRGPGQPVGYLHPDASIPAVLDADTVCVYSSGLTAAPGDDLVVLITGATGGGTVTDITTYVPSAAPLAAIRSDRIAFTDTSLQALNILGFNGTSVNFQSTTGLTGTADGTSSPENLSIPFSPDGSDVFTLYGGGTILHRVNGGQTTTWPAASALKGRPIVFSNGRLAAPGSANNLVVFSESGVTPTITTHALRSPLNATAKVLFAPLGAGGILLPLQGADNTSNTGDDEIQVFTEPLLGTSVRLGFAGTPMLAPLGSGEMIMFGPGADRLFNTSDDSSIFINASATDARNFTTRTRWNQIVPPETDTTRAFVVDSGPDRIYGNGDERLIVQQSIVVGAFVDGALLPLALSGVPATGGEAFVPIGRTWGIVRSPGAGSYGDADDHILIVRY